MLRMSSPILELIKNNRISSVEVSDALGKTGVLAGISALNPGHFIVGPVFYTCAFDESNWPLHEQIQEVPRGSIVLVDAIDCGDRAVFGDIVSKYLLLYQGAAGIVVNGLVRDAHRLRKENYPIWSKGITPLGCFNRNVTPSKNVAEHVRSRKKYFQDALLVADDSGCTVITRSDQESGIINALQRIEMQEDIWYFCVDVLKMSTYDTICLKDYLKNPKLLPQAMTNIDAKNIDTKD